MLLLIDKISGITSQDAISAVKKALRAPYRNALSDEEKLAGVKPAKIKIGHSGTLDPMASGLLIAATDKETKQLHHLTGLDKSYIATIDFSIITDTWDMDYWKEFEQYQVVESSNSFGLTLPSSPLQITPSPSLPKRGDQSLTPHRYNKEFIQSRGLLSTGYHLPYSKDAYEKAKQLRKNMTIAEQQLRNFYLQKSGYTVLRQKAIDHYIVDFYIAKYKLVIEIDGDYHNSIEQQEYDQERSKILNFYGLHVMRFTNEKVLSCLGDVQKNIEQYITNYKNTESRKKKLNNDGSNPMTPLFNKEESIQTIEKDTHQGNGSSNSISPSLAKRGAGGGLVYIQAPTLTQFQKSLNSLIGTHNLPLTPFSAKKVNGKKLYEYAREGKAIFLTVPMSIHGFEVLDYQFPLLTLRLDVGSGTYIRSIAHRLGNQFKLGGTLTMLRRIQIGEYTIDQITDNNKQIALWDEKEIPYSKL